MKAEQKARDTWGLKHSCMACQCRFYDLEQTPAVCPRCGATCDSEALFRNRRGKAAAASKDPVVVDPGLTDLEDPAGLDPDNADDDIVPDLETEDSEEILSLTDEDSVPTAEEPRI